MGTQWPHPICDNHSSSITKAVNNGGVTPLDIEEVLVAQPFLRCTREDLPSTKRGPNAHLHLYLEKPAPGGRHLQTKTNTPLMPLWPRICKIVWIFWRIIGRIVWISLKRSDGDWQLNEAPSIGGSHLLVRTALQVLLEVLGLGPSRHILNQLG